MPTKTLTITGMTPITSGVGNYGPWTLYGVDATAEDGTVIPDTLKTFQELPIGEQITVEVEKNESEQYGTEYMLKKPKGARYGLRQSPADESWTDHEMRIRAIEKHLGLVPASMQPVTDVPAPPVSAPVTVPADDEIPF